MALVGRLFAGYQFNPTFGEWVTLLSWQIKAWLQQVWLITLVDNLKKQRQKLSHSAEKETLICGLSGRSNRREKKKLLISRIKHTHLANSSNGCRV